jgi:hypothetical protein
MQVKTNKNVRFDEPLSSLISLRLTDAEKAQIEATAKTNYISVTEVLRNLVREHIHEYATSKGMKKYLFISNQIDKVLLEDRIISARKETNLSKMREILSSFEFMCEENVKKVDTVAFISQRNNISLLVGLIYENDTYLSDQIDAQYRRILKTKTYRALENIISDDK